MTFKISPGVEATCIDWDPILPTKVYAVIVECWWHAVATEPVCVYSDKAAAEYHVALLKEKGWHASVSELEYNPNPEEFTKTCTPREEFYKNLEEKRNEIDRKNNLK